MPSLTQRSSTRRGGWRRKTRRHSIAILTEKRTAVEGGKLPSIAEKRESRDEALRIIGGAQSVIREREIGDWKAGISAANLAAFEKGARLSRLTDAPYVDADGKAALYSAEQQREHAVNAYLGKSEAIAIARRETTGQRRDRELAAFAPSGEPHPVWKARLAAYPQGVDVATLSNPEARAAIVDDFNLFRHVKTKSQTMLPAVTTAQSRGVLQ